MKQLLSPALVKNSLSSHSWLGLLVGIMMYLVCLSGTLAVFYQEFERWEQPTVEEFKTLPSEELQGAYNTVLAQSGETHHMYVSLPSATMPRASISSDDGGWFLNSDGSLGEKVSHEWTHLLTELHIFLHLPENFGVIVVSILGAMLCGLIISGFLAHPRLFRDAFTLRLKGSKHLEQADIHNRLSVWGSPFYLMIAITGAYFGLALLLSLVVAPAFFDGKTDDIIPAVFGAEPTLDQAPHTAEVAKALAQMPAIAPEGTPFYITVEDVGSAEQYIIVGAQHHDRLIYAEQYQFDGMGNYLNKIGFSDGEAGRQAIFSVYRLHFGHYGGFFVKVLYGIFGLALTVVSVSGINIWFARRKSRDALNNLWLGFVWGAPLALSATAISQLVFHFHSIALFWFCLLACSSLAQVINNELLAKALLLKLNAAALIGLVIAYGVQFNSHALQLIPLAVNISLVAIAIIFLRMAPSKAALQAARSAH
jgi:uncharacterized iron-regulated membrane protein